MKKTPRSVLEASLLLLAAVVALQVSAAPTSHCHVSGDISQSVSTAPFGSRQNPYSSLAEVEADSSCKKITVLYSGIELDGGIALKDGQALLGKRGPNGELPVLTNSTENNNGAGIFLARDNELRNIRIQDTQSSGILGANQFNPYGGDLVLRDLQVTGANQAGNLIPDGSMALASIMLVTPRDSNVHIEDVYAGEANVPTIAVLQFGGHLDVKMRDVTVNDQNQLTQSFEFSPGIYVAPFGSASADVDVRDTTVTDVGSEFISNSDGLLLISFGSGNMTVNVDNYTYSNPDGGGWFGSSSGIEVGVVHAPGGAVFEGIITNSRVDGAYFTGIQVVDDDTLGNNSVSVTIRDNEVSDVLFGIEAFIDSSPHSSMYVDISDNVISTTPRFGYSEGIFLGMGTGPINNFEAHIESNTIQDVVGTALAFASAGDPIANVQLDAGLGNLGSAGQNRIIGTVGADVFSFGVPASAANNWWGRDAGPSVIVEENGGTVDVDPFLTVDPGQKNNK